MTQAQLVILWTVAGLLASVLFFVGLGKPYLVNAEYEKRKTAAYFPVMEVLQKIPDEDNRKSRAFEVAVELVAKRVDEISKEQKADPTAQRNYITGAVVPILILGACAFITAGRQRTPPPARN